MAAAPAKRLVVFGGNGFLGSRICKFGVLRGWDVTSISRSGQPRWDAVSDTAAPPSWARRVSWERADVFAPQTYAPLLRGASYAVHSLGILLEADYKGVLSGKDSPLEGLRKVFAGKPAPAAATPATPAAAPGSKGAAPPTSRPMTYEAMNRDSAILAAQAAAAGGVEAFAYISAAAGAPGLPSRYLSTKRDAEQALAIAATATAAAATGAGADTTDSLPRLGRPIFVRAPLLYDAGARPLTVPVAALAGAGTAVNRFTGGALSGLLGSLGTKPLRANEVAEAVVEALSDASVEGVVDVPQITQLANRAWRKGML